jgi:hypothetical protein
MALATEGEKGEGMGPALRGDWAMAPWSMLEVEPGVIAELMAEFGWEAGSTVG